MLEQIAEALERRDIATASLLLEKLQQQQPENPWLQFYRARLDEMQGRLTQAEELYREILRVSINSKVSAQARQGLQRLVDLEKNQKEVAIANAKTEPGGEELGMLILEAIEPAAKAT
ncbi:MAG: tetratricopeptide repeat protein, partial [Xenococcaceae cyanobacterium]